MTQIWDSIGFEARRQDPVRIKGVLVLGLALIRDSGRTVIAVYDPETERVAALSDQPEWTSALALLEAGIGDGLDSAEHGEWSPAGEADFLPPALPAARIICVAQNYSAHARESSGTDSPPDPVMFLKPHSALVGHGQPTSLSPATSFFDWEAELGVVVGRDLSDVDEPTAAAAIVGYTIANDGTARDLQPIELGGRQIVDWFSAKSIDASSVLGPAVFPANRVEDPTAIRITLDLNGERMQDDVAGSMNVSPASLLSRISRIISLHRGDVLLTGTPAGVGKARGVSLHDGDELVIAAEPLGRLRTRIAAP